MEVFGLVLEDFDELDHAAIADIERAIEFQHARVAFGILIEFRDVFRADQDRGVLVVGSTGGTTPTPTRLRLEKLRVATGNSS